MTSTRGNLPPNDPVRRHLEPQSFLEAGGETVAILIAAAERSINELCPGQVLEIISSQPSAHGALIDWCREMDYELLDWLTEGSVSQFWIRQRERR